MMAWPCSTVPAQVYWLVGVKKYLLEWWPYSTWGSPCTYRAQRPGSTWGHPRTCRGEWPGSTWGSACTCRVQWPYATWWRQSTCQGQGPGSTWGSPCTCRDKDQVLPEEVQVLSGTMARFYLRKFKYLSWTRAMFYLRKSKYLSGTMATFSLTATSPVSQQMFSKSLPQRICTVQLYNVCVYDCTEVGTPFCLLYYVMKCNTKQGFCTWRQCYRKHPTRRQIMWVIGIIYPY